MLLVDDDEAELAERQEQRGAGAHHQPGAAVGHRAPRPPTTAVGDAGVPLGGAGSEAGLHPVEKLDRQGDLRQEHQGLAAAGERLGDRFEIDLGLARTGDALQQRGGIAAGGDGRAQGRGGGGLVVRQRAGRGAGVERGVGRVPGDDLPGDHSLGLEPLDDARADAGKLRQLARREAEIAVCGEGRHHPGAGVGQALRGLAGQAEERPRARRLAQPGRAGGEAQHGGERGEGVVGGAGEERAHLVAHRRDVEPPGDVAQLLRGEAAGPRPPDHAEHATRTERNRDERRRARRRPRARGSRARGRAPRR